MRMSFNIPSGCSPQVKSQERKIHLQQVCDITIAKHLYLEQIAMDQNPKVFVDEGVISGSARSFVTKIGPWADIKEASEIEAEGEF